MYFFYFTTNHHFLWKLIILTWLCFNVSIDNAGLRALFPPNNPSFLIIAKIKLFLRNSRHSSSPIASPPTSHPSWTSSTFFVLIGVCAHLSWHQLTVLTQKFQRDLRGHDDVLYYTYKATFETKQCYQRVAYMFDHNFHCFRSALDSHSVQIVNRL